MSITKDAGTLFLDIQREKMRMVNLLLAQSLNCLAQAKTILGSVNDDLSLWDKSRAPSKKEIYALDEHRKK
ncbi:MAG: hypothetical protein WAO23_04370 [Dethiobacteria bacterium]